MSILPQLSERDKAILNSILNPSLPLGGDVFNEEDISTGSQEAPETEDTEEIRKIEMSAIQKAENSMYDDSLSLFQILVNMAPERAATFNNRAQVYMLQGKFSEGYLDLEKAINLSNGKGKVCLQAYCQRGVMYRKEGKVDLSKQDFQQAAKLGSSFAKQQLIEMNPYAALCNQMLSQVMQKLK